MQRLGGLARTVLEEAMQVESETAGDGLHASEDAPRYIMAQEWRAWAPPPQVVRTASLRIGVTDLFHSMGGELHTSIGVMREASLTREEGVMAAESDMPLTHAAQYLLRCRQDEPRSLQGAVMPPAFRPRSIRSIIDTRALAAEKMELRQANVQPRIFVHPACQAYIPNGESVQEHEAWLASAGGRVTEGGQ